MTLMTSRRLAVLTVSALACVLLAALVGVAGRSSCSDGDVQITCPTPPTGPDGTAVSDKFFFVHRTLTGDGAVTVRVTSMTGLITYPPPDHDEIVPGVVPWAKAGVIVKAGTNPGSPYAAVMVTGKHGVRMQQDFTEDVAGRPGGVGAGAPRWLRLTRAGSVVTGYESTDGAHWTEVSTGSAARLPGSVQLGFFVASPGDLTLEPAPLGGMGAADRLAILTAVFDHVSVDGSVSGAWTTTDVSAVAGDGPGGIHHPGGMTQAADSFTLTGNGDIAPLGSTDGAPLERTLLGTVFLLVGVIVVGSGLGRDGISSSRVRGLAVAAFVTGLITTTASVVVGTAVMRAGGTTLLPVSVFTKVRVVVGTAVVVALVAVLALALAAALRRRRAAVAMALVLAVVPYVLAMAAVVPLEAAQWLLRLTPAAGFAIQQSLPAYPQVPAFHAPGVGYFPLPPWAGLAALAGWTALALGVSYSTDRPRSTRRARPQERW